MAHVWFFFKITQSLIALTIENQKFKLQSLQSFPFGNNKDDTP